MNIDIYHSSTMNTDQLVCAVIQELTENKNGLTAKNLARRVGTSSKKMKYVLATNTGSAHDAIIAVSRTPYSKKKRNMWYLKANAPSPVKYSHAQHDETLNECEQEL